MNCLANLGQIHLEYYLLDILNEQVNFLTYTPITYIMGHVHMKL